MINSFTEFAGDSTASMKLVHNLMKMPWDGIGTSGVIMSRHMMSCAVTSCGHDMCTSSHIHC